MIRRRSIHAAAAFAALVAPLTALAQAPTGSVTTAPIHNVPALGMSLFVMLALALAGLGIYRLRRTVSRRTVAIALVAAVTVLAGLGYAGATSIITITGADCMKQTVSLFNPLMDTTVISNCTNRIQVLDIQVSCGAGDVTAETDINSAANGVHVCSVGEVLADGDSCRLPICV